jgi:hypothetical protein
MMIIKGIEPPPQLRSLMEIRPIVRSLFVMTDKVATAAESMKREGTIEHEASIEVSKLQRIENIYKFIEDEKAKKVKKG